jgi:hypothetical protein
VLSIFQCHISTNLPGISKNPGLRRRHRLLHKVCLIKPSGGLRLTSYERNIVHTKLMSILNANFFSFLHLNLISIERCAPAPPQVRMHGPRAAEGAPDGDRESSLALPAIEIVLVFQCLRPGGDH